MADETNAVQRDGRLYFGVCDTASGTSTKVVVLRNPVMIEGEPPILDLEVGDELIVKFNNGNSVDAPQLELQITDQAQDTVETGEISTIANTENIEVILTPGYYEWDAQQLIGFVYVDGAEISDGTNSNHTHYWKAFQIDKATNTTYGVTKVIGDESFLDENGDQPVSWDLIQSQLIKQLTPLTLEYADTGILSAKRPIDEEEATVQLPVIERTSQLINDGEVNNGASDEVKFIENVKPWVLNTGDGLGYHVTVDGTETHIPNFVPNGRSGDNNVVRVGNGSMKFYQEGDQSQGDPRTWIYGQYIRLGLDALDTNQQSGQTTRLEIGGVDMPGGHWYPWYIFNEDGANFIKPLNINGTPLNTYINNLIKNYDYKVLKTRTRTTKIARYNAGSQIPQWWDSGKKEWVADTTGNQTLSVTQLSGYTPIGIIGFNVNEVDGNRAADDFYVWECYLNSTGTTIHYGLKNTSKDQFKCQFEVTILYCKNNFFC